MRVILPLLQSQVYDGACGSAGFLCESFDYLKRENPKRTTAQDRTLQERTFYGKEKKSLAYVIAIMNMILHGIEAPNIIHTNTLTENLADIQEKDRYEVVMAKARSIQHMMCTTFWHPDGTPMSAQQFMELLFGKLPQFFKDEAELRAIWSAPDTRKKLLQGLADKRFRPRPNSPKCKRSSTPRRAISSTCWPMSLTPWRH
jgi:N-6 DNA Methylase